MKLPTQYIDKSEWTFAGPMGPMVPDTLLHHPVLGVDGGAAFSTRLDIWVGDSDSHTGEVKAAHVFHHPRDKDHSDLALALSILNHSLPYRLHLWGFLGGRRDHELFNLGEASAYLKAHTGSEILFYDQAGKISFRFFGKGHWHFNCHGTFSLGCIEKTSLKLSGNCLYPIPEMTQLDPLSSFGLSNEGDGKINIECQGPLFVHFPEEK